MNPHGTTITRTVGLAALLLALASCTTPGIKDEVDLGADRENRPGDVYAEMGQAYMREGQPRVALRKLKRGLEADPGNPQIHAVLGRLYQQLGEAEQAKLHYSKASDLEPQNPYFHNAWGSFLCQQQDYDAADEQFQQALLNPLYDRPWQAATNAGLCAYRAGRPEQASAYLHNALSRNPSIPQALLKMAIIENERGKLDQAQGYLQRYTALAPHTPQTLLLGLRIERSLGNKVGADRYLEILQQGYPDAPETRTAKELNES